MRLLSQLRLAAASAALIAAAASAVVAAPAHAETLADAIALAYQTNPGIQATRAQLRALNESFVQARAGFGPRVSAEADLAYEEIRVPRRGSFQDQASTETLALSQPIFSSGRLSAGLDAAEADVRAGRERLRQAEADLLQRVIAAYVAVRRDQQILAVLRSSVEAYRQRLEEVEARVKVGENTRTDLAQAQSRYAQAQGDAAAAEANLASSRASYMNAVGQNPGELAPEPDLPPLPPNVDAAFDAAEAGNHTLQAAKYQELGSRNRVAEARTQRLPNVNLRVQAGRSPSAVYSPNPYINSVQATAVVTQPLFTAGVLSSQIRRANETNNADRLNIDTTRRNVVQTLSQQWSQLSAARTGLVADETSIRASELAFFGMREEERFGLRSTIELLNAQQELSSAQIGFLRNRFAEYTSRAAVLNLVGALNVNELAPGVAPYDAEGDFDRVKNKGALPTELVVRTLDRIVTGPPDRPRAASETITPDQQPTLPPPPPKASDVEPIRTVSDIVDEPAGLPADVDQSKK